MTARRPALLILLLLAGCGGGTPTAPLTAPPTVSGGAATVTSAGPTTGAPTSPAATTTAPEPVVADEPCPYLDTGFVQDTVGQHIARTTVTSTSHETLPGCSFFRPDGEPAAAVEVTELGTAAAAQTAAIELGTPKADPVDGIGDGGVVLVSTDGTVLAVSSGSVLLVVRINQASSLEARALAARVAPQLTG